MNLHTLRSQLHSILAEIDEQIARDEPPALDYDTWEEQALAAFQSFEGPDPTAQHMQALYKETTGSLPLTHLLASRVQFAENKSQEPMKSPGGYMLAVLNKADRGKLRAEAEQRFAHTHTAPVVEEEVDEEDPTPPIVAQTLAATKKRLSAKDLV